MGKQWISLVEKSSNFEKEVRIEERAVPGRMGNAGVAEIPAGAVAPHHRQIGLDPTAEYLAVINAFVGAVIGGAGAVQVLHYGR